MKVMRYLFIIGLCLIAIVLAAYVLLSAKAITAAYEGRSIESLNNAVSGQDKHSVEFYIELADILFLKLLAAAVSVLITAYLILRWVTRAILRRRSRERTTAETAQISRLKRITGGALCSLMSIGVVFAFWVFAYKHYLQSLPGFTELSSPSYEGPEFPKLTPEQILNLGWAHSNTDHIASSYLWFDEEKEPGRIRIGLFGCSYTYGEESGPGHDPASFLQGVFRENGFDQVDVINFGVGSYGMHQAYLMWKWLGSKYDLDHVVFLPFTWHQPRDRSFIFGGGYNRPHARLIAGRSGLEILPVLGESPREAAAIYHEFIPRLRYLRYDEKAPPSFQALVPASLRIAMNPFYHEARWNKEEESLETYRLIFHAVAQESKNVLVVANDATIYGLRESVAAPNLSFFRSELETFVDGPLHFAPMGHLSAIGNRLRTEEIFSFLSGKQSHTFQSLALKDTDTAPSDDNEFGALHEYERAHVSLQDHAVAQFLMHSKGGPSHSFGEPLSFRERKVSALLQQFDEEGPRFLPVDFPLEDAAPVTLEFKNNARVERAELGNIESMAGIMGRIRGGNLPWKTGDPSSGWRAELCGKRQLDEVAIGGIAGRVEDVKITLAGNVAITGTRRPGNKLVNLLRRILLFRGRGRLLHHFVMRPAVADFAFLRAAAGQYVPVEELEEKSGNLELALTLADGSEERAPMFLGYDVIETAGTPFERPYHSPIR